MKSENIISSAMFSASDLFTRQGLPLPRQWQAASLLWQKKDECIENIITDGETGMLFEKMKTRRSCFIAC